MKTMLLNFRTAIKAEDFEAVRDRLRQALLDENNMRAGDRLADTDPDRTLVDAIATHLHALLPAPSDPKFVIVLDCLLAAVTVAVDAHAACCKPAEDSETFDN